PRSHNPEPPQTRKTHPGPANRLPCMKKDRIAQTQRPGQNRKTIEFFNGIGRKYPLEPYG
ncbi:hypothetical protein, partial [Roseibium marinum]|uniref:hypothetical protein n=1 Tax=Roseibium marinum TaxID=281252 RepID=UPI001AD914DB